jgi:hypothetical protein
MLREYLPPYAFPICAKRFDPYGFMKHLILYGNAFTDTVDVDSCTDFDEAEFWTKEVDKVYGRVIVVTPEYIRSWENRG